MNPRPPVPTTLICGPLGVGKTTAIRGLFRQRPAHERWAVLVNEFGEVGIDGALLSDEAPIVVREIAGGCICCTSGPMLRVALVRLLREQQPDRLLIEPTGLAHPASLLDLLRAPGVREGVAPRSVISLVDVRRFEASLNDPLRRDLLLAGDILVGTFADVAEPERVSAFLARAGALEPPPALVVALPSGALDAAWLDHTSSPRSPSFRILAEASAAEASFTWPPEQRFDLDRLQGVLQTLVRPGPLLPAGAARLKGIFFTSRGWLYCDASPDRIAFEPVGWRRDNRVVVIAVEGSPDWTVIQAAFNAAGDAHTR